MNAPAIWKSKEIGDTALLAPLRSHLARSTESDHPSMPSTPGYDIIGDIHGHADALERLLSKLGYTEKNAVYAHPHRQAIFLGDFIDRGPKILRVLEIARSMVEAGSALAVLGNHELNALAFQTRDQQDATLFLRRRNEKNLNQHRETLHQLSAVELASHLEWFRSLPIWLERDGLRVVHACWDHASLETIGQYWQLGKPIDNTFLQQAFRDEQPPTAPTEASCHGDMTLAEAVEIVTKGKEAKLPPGVYFEDKDGHRREQIRVKWFESPEGKTYANYALQSDPIACEQLLSQDTIDQASPYAPTEPPVFIGHYWLSAERPRILASNVACLDYSVAKKGFLCCYRWNGENTLSDEQFVW
jgi:hypothetical protein